MRDILAGGRNNWFTKASQDRLQRHEWNAEYTDPRVREIRDRPPERSGTITSALIEAFEARVYHIFQREGMKRRAERRAETVKTLSDFYGGKWEEEPTL